MTTIQLNGRITEEGELEIKLPEGLPPGEARITIEISPGEAWTQEELARAVRIEPMSGSEIVEAGLTGGWEDQGITDSTGWVEEQRRKRRDQRAW
jgi:hypothetical protein